MSERILLRADRYTNLVTEAERPAITYTFTSLDGEREYMRVMGDRIYIDGQETSDVERIGARVREWAQQLSSPDKGEESK